MNARTERTVNKELRDRVEQQLDWEPEVISTDIGVAALDGVVTLTGYVESYTEKLAAEKAAIKTFGVRAVANDIEVKPLNKITDTEIAASVVSTLHFQHSVPDERIQTTVKGGFVYLDGEVDWKYQKDAAERLTSSLAGVRSVMNRIVIKPRVSTTDVKRKIEEALRRSAELDARRITVTATDSKVELWGNVRTWLEKNEAEQAAWAAPGVTNVESHLHVMP